MRCIVKIFRRPPKGFLDDRNGGLPRLSDSAAHGSRCPASPRRTLLAENLGKPSLWVIITTPWYYILKIPNSVGSIGALSAAESPNPSTIRVSAGSITPSSHSRALA